MSGKKAQIHVLEAVVAGTLIIGGIIFAIQSTAVTPLTVSTSEQHIETQQQKMANGILQSADSIVVNETTEATALEEAVLYWDTEAQTFHQASLNTYQGGTPPNKFGELLQQTFTSEDIATNVELIYTRDGGNISSTVSMVNQGTPSDNAVTASKTVVLLDTDRLESPQSSVQLTDSASYFAPDTAPDSNIYNVVTVRIILWRI